MAQVFKLSSIVYFGMYHKSTKKYVHLVNTTKLVTTRESKIPVSLVTS